MALELKRLGDRTWFEGKWGDWRFEFRLKPDRDGQWAICELRVAPDYRSVSDTLKPLRHGLTKEILKQLPLIPELRYARSVIAEQKWDPKSRDDNKPVGPGRPPVASLDVYRRVGKEWNKLVGARDPHPAKTLAAQFKWRGKLVSRSTMRSILYRYDALAQRGAVVPRASVA